MYALLTRLMLLAALAQLGISVADFSDCRGRECVLRLARARNAVLRVEWVRIAPFRPTSITSGLSRD